MSPSFVPLFFGGKDVLFIFKVCVRGSDCGGPFSLFLLSVCIWLRLFVIVLYLSIGLDTLLIY